MRILLLLSIFFTYSIASAQTFSTNIDVRYPSNDSGWELIKVEDGLIIGALSYFDNVPISRFSLTKTDFQGNIEWQKRYDTLSIYSLNIVIADGGFLWAGLANITAPQNKVRFLKLNLDGEIVGEVASGDPSSTQVPLRLIKVGTNYCLASYLSDDSSDEYMLFQFYNAQQELEEEIFFEDMPPINATGGSDLIRTPDGGMLGAAITDGSISRAHLTKMDALGTVEWSIVTNGSWGADCNLGQFGDGSYALAWYRDTTINDTFPYVSTLYNLDSAGDIKWQHPFYIPDNELLEIIELKTLSNGDILGLGYRQFRPFGSENAGRCGWMFRIQSDGTLLWERTICDEILYFNNFVQVFYDGVELANGDLVLLGNTQNSIIVDGETKRDSDIWLVRTDSLGCLEPGCESEQLITSTQQPRFTQASSEFTLFPNPASNTAYLQWQGQVPTKQSTELRLYHTTGQLVRQYAIPILFPGQQVPIALEGLVPGAYFYRWEYGSGVLVVK